MTFGLVSGLVVVYLLYLCQAAVALLNFLAEVGDHSGPVEPQACLHGCGMTPKMAGRRMGVQPSEDLLSEIFLVWDDDAVALLGNGMASPVFQHRHSSIVNVEGW